MPYKSSRLFIVFAALLFIGALSFAESVPEAASPGMSGSGYGGVGTLGAARILVGEEVVATGVEPLGANLSAITGGTNFATNNFIRGSGMEPAVVRYLVRVERSGAGWIEWDESLGGVHMWEQNADGFGDGAVIRLYRIVDAAGQPLSYGNGTELQDASGADHVVFLGETTVPEGGWHANGPTEGAAPGANRVYLQDRSLRLAYGDHAIITITKYDLPATQIDPRLYQWSTENNGIMWLPDGATATLVPHPGHIPALFDEPGDACLEVDLPGGSGGWIGQYLFHAYDDGEGMWYSQLEPGAFYTARVWLRQEGLAGGEVRFAGAGPYETIAQSLPWRVTDQWREYTFDFTGPEYPEPGTWHGGFGLEVQGPGTIWIDNFVVYRNETEYGNAPFTPHRISLDEMLSVMPEDGPKPAIRFYNLSYPGHSPMERLLSNYASSSLDFIYNIQPATQTPVPHLLNWALATGDAPDNRVVPYLTLSEEYTEVEWLQLVEYLGVPFDPDVDSPDERPWAYLRYTQGQLRPWTDEFREIVLEFGNETWHEGVFAGWDGFGRPGWVHFGGAEYGLFARYYFDETVAAQPWWEQYDLGSRITFALNANYEGQRWAYGELAAQQIPDLPTYLGHANYVGPKWETGEEPFQQFDAHGMQETLVGAYTQMYQLIDDVASTRADLMAGGAADYRPIAYEGGPSGYYVPGNGTDEQVAISELYGKSLGMAVSALDVWLYSSLRGYGYQEYFSYGSGNGWSSHTMPRAGGFRPHSGWLALELRNRFARGDRMLETRLETVPTYSREGEAVPLIASYTVTDGQSISVFVLSRAYPGQHDDVDFGNGVIPVTISLPSGGFKSITRYTLASPDDTFVDPASSNIERENIVISAVDLDAATVRRVNATGALEIVPETGGVTGGMPPGTVFLYVLSRDE